MLLDVALLEPPYKTYTYKIPSYLESSIFSPGTRAVVPVKNRFIVGIILKNYKGPEVLHFEIKEVLMPLEKKPLYSPAHLEVIEEISKHLLVEPGQIISLSIPSAIKSLKLYFHDKQGKKYSIKNVLKNDPESLTTFIIKWISGDVELITSHKKHSLLELNSPPPWPIRPNARVQLNLLEYLYINGPQPKSSLTHHFGKNITQTISTLLKKGLIREKQVDKTPKFILSQKFCQKLIPTEEQKNAISSLTQRMEQGVFNIALLYGVTGSGKTLVYANLIKKALELNKSALLLLPEVALAEGVYREIKSFFSNVPIYFYHGYLSPAYRYEIFKEISRQDQNLIVIGTRSSIFLPIKRPGIIIIDEEHDSSYKQEERLRYHVRDVAYLLAKRFNSLLLFGSATPDVRTFYASKNKDILLLKMKKRVGERKLPNIKLINLNEQPPKFGPFSEEVFREIKSTIDEGDQIIILLNRRGFSPLMWCTSCKEVVKCSNCSVSMTYHKKMERLICHYCGLSIPFPTTCPICGSCSFIPLDHGTEQVEEFVNTSFGNKCSILRLDRDSYKKEKNEEDILLSFAKGHYQILVGTQMCSKGHNFPKVTLVVVVNGDIGLNLPDYRATERTFQLLLQVAGRSGRGEKQGRVYIQTRNPNHYCWQYILKNDYDGFFSHELELRRQRRYPPFVKLALMRFQFNRNWPQGEKIISEIKKDIRNISSKSIRVLGPAPAPIFIMNNQKRYQCLIKAEKWSPIREFAFKIMEKYSNISKKLKVILDLDPYQML